MRWHRRDALAGLAGVAAAGLAGAVRAQSPPPVAPDSPHLTFADPVETIDLWPGGAPGAPARLPVETVRERSRDPAYNDRYVFGISRPRMAVFRPARSIGASVMIMPGGGYQWVVIDKEGYEMARWLAGRGITAFVLFYRLPHEGWAAGPDVALGDAQRATRLVRYRARGWGLDPQRICAMGFSAGGHVCADLATRFDAWAYDPIDEADGLSARPDAAAPIYPVISMSRPHAHEGSRLRLIGEQASAEVEQAHSPHLNVRPGCPPCFLLHAEDDASVPVSNTLMLRDRLVAQHVAVETHLFPDGGHGFGLRLARGKSVENWPDLFFAWGRRRGLWS